MTPKDIIDKIKEKAVDYARTHATENAKRFYILGKRDAASIFLTMIKEDGEEAAIKDVAKELLKNDPSNENAKWILEKWKKN